MLYPNAMWEVADTQPEEAKQLAEAMGISTAVAQILLHRNIRTAEEGMQFLHPEDEPFYDPFLMAGMEAAVTRIRQAVENREKIFVFGDYDADGVTSTAIIMHALTEIGAEATYYIPNRFTEGYGVNESAIQQAQASGFGLLVTVDTGITAVDEVEVAKEGGIDMIITDHHQPPPALPDAFCILNPHQEACAYPFQELSGAGVAFKMAHALLGNVPEHLLDLTALGTIADLVPLVGENRLIAIRGIEAMKTSQKAGMQALLKVAGVDKQNLTAKDIGFALGPRINAAGRLDTAEPAVRLLLAGEAEEAKALSEDIDGYNRKRKTLVDEITTEAIGEIEERFLSADDDIFVVAEEDWNSGVIGIVASRIVEQYHHPAIIMGIDRKTGLAKGSGRSIAGFDMFYHLSACRDLFLHFGGHPMAAGMTLRVEDIDGLRARLNKQARSVLTPEDFRPTETVDLVCMADEITLAMIEEMQKLAPFGTANPTPKIMIKDTPLASIKQVGAQQDHLKAVFTQSGAQLQGIGFRLGHLYHEISAAAKTSAIGEVQVNEWNGFRRPQFMIEDLAVREWQLFDVRSGRNLRERLGSLPAHKRLFIAFHEGTTKQLGISEWCEPVECITEDAPESRDFSSHYMILLDLPSSIEQLTGLFRKAIMPERIYAVFYHQDRGFIAAPPSRSQFKWFYGFLMQRQSFDFQQYGQRLARMKGLSKETLDFMVDVFSELQFIFNQNGKLSVNQAPVHQDLENSALYQERQQQAALENDLCYSSYSSLKQWFDNINTTSNHLEGVVN